MPSGAKTLLLAALLAAALAGALARPLEDGRQLAEEPKAPFPDPGACDRHMDDQPHQLCCFIKRRNAEITGKPADWKDASCFDLRSYNGAPCSAATKPAQFRLCCTDKRARAPYARPGFEVDPSCPKA